MDEPILEIFIIFATATVRPSVHQTDGEQRGMIGCRKEFNQSTVCKNRFLLVILAAVINVLYVTEKNVYGL